MRRLLIISIILFALTAILACSGPQGTQGPPGAAGATGPQGPAGVSNPPGLTVASASPAQCPSGGVLLTVSYDSWGTSSSSSYAICNGTNGNPGMPGMPGTQIKMIQFCPGSASYPSTFLEYGMLIGTSVYGVYSANDGFLAYLPPGLYLSNAINSTCDFTINADGSITN